MKHLSKNDDTRFKMLYDGKCFVCRRFSRLVTFLDRKGRIIPVPFQDFFKTESHIPYDQLAAMLHIIKPDGDILTGFDAVEEIYSVLFNKGPLRWLESNRFWKFILNYFYRFMTIFRSRCSSCTG